MSRRHGAVGVPLAAIWAVVPSHHPDRATRLDVLGAVTVTAATGSLIYGMLNAGDRGWADLGTLLAIAAAIVGYGAFVVVERTVPTPLLRLNLLSRRPIAAGAFLMLVAAGVLIADLFLGSQYLQHLRGLSALETGLFFLPPALALMIGAITAGRLVGTIGARPVAVVALILVAIGNGLLIGVSADGNVYAEALPGVVVFALGGGPLFVCATTTALGRAGLHQAGLVSGIVQTCNQLGAAICVAVASTVAAAGLTSTPSIDGFTDAFTMFTVVALALVAIGNGLLIGVSADGSVYAEALPGVVVFALGGGPLFVCATTAALGRVSQHEAGLVSGIVNTFNQLGAAICVAVASTIAAAGLTGTPSIEGFTDAYTVFTVVAAVATVVSLRLVPSGTPQLTGAPHAH